MVVETKSDLMNIGTVDYVSKQRWIQTAIQQNAKYIIVACDEFDYDDYPIFAQTKEEADKKIDECNKESMQRVMGLYDITIN